MRASGVVAFVLLFSLVGDARAGTDGWTVTGPPGGTATALALDPGSPSTMYAGGDLGFARSDDGGVTWTQLTAGLPPSSAVTAIAVDSFASTVWVATDKGLFKSTDSGV